MSAVGDLRIWGYSKTDPRAVNPAMARRAAAAMAAAARRRGVRVVMWSPSDRSGRSLVLGGDPGGEDAVGVVGQVVADQGVEEVLVVGKVRGGDGHQLAVAGRGGGRGGSR